MRSLRWKMLAFALGVSASVVGGVWAIQRAIVAPEFAEIERREADANLARVAEAIAQEADQLAEHAQDYAAWDEALAFSRGKNAGFLASNFVPETFENLRIDFGLIALENGEVAFARALHAESGELASDRELERILLEPRLRLLAHDAPSSKRAGLIASERGFVLVSTAAITDNDQAAAPAGSIVFARRVDAELIAALVKRVRSDLALSDLSASGAADANAARGAGTATWHDVASDETLLAYQALADINGAPVALLRVELPRTTSRRAAAAANLTAITGAVGGAVLLAVIWWVLTRFVLDPLERVTEHAVRLGATGDLGARIGLESGDEIGVLARELDAMAERLERSRAQLVDVAHQAGRAEAASAVLHDIGNVLTSVTVSLSLATESVARSESGALRRVALLLREHEEKLATFLEQDARGRQVLPFLDELASELEHERTRSLEELKALGAGIEHVAALVRAQNRNAGAKLVLEPLDPSRVASEAARLVKDAYARHQIGLSLELETHERVALDRRRCLQVLTNLLSNAEQAVRAARQAGGSATVRVTRDHEWVSFAVIDDGAGIAPDVLTQIFRLGFSTRPDGQGIGLHNAANLAREMGGSLVAHSDGAGRGASFTLRIPARGTSTS